MDLSRLKEPFPENEIEWRLQSCGEKNGKVYGRCLAYVTNRAIQNRLDEVVGAENWKNRFIEGPDGGVLCGLSIKINGEWVEKFDGAENTDIEAVKGGLSGAMKRAAATGWGIGRYLYSLKDNWAIITDKGEYSGKTKTGISFKWNPPKLPKEALPSMNSEDQALIDRVNGYIESGVLDGDFAKKAKFYIDTQKYSSLKDVIKYCEEKENGK